MKKEDWPKVKLAEVARVDWGNTNLTKSAYDFNGPYLGVSAAGADGRMNHYEHDAGVTVISAIGANCGKVFYLNEKFTAIKNTMTVTPNVRLVHPRYLYLVMQKNSLPRRGGGQPFISKGDTEEYKIPLPPLTIQEEVVHSLDIANDLKIKREKADKKMADFASALFYKMFGDPAKNEKGWEMKKLGEITEVIAGSTPSSTNPDYWNGEINWVTPAEMENEDFYIMETRRKITKAGFESCSTKLFPKDSVILSTRAPIGKVAVAGGVMCSNQGIKALVPRAEVLQATYLFWWLKQQTYYLNSLGSGATFKELSSAALKSVLIQVPPLELQVKFADHLTKARALQERQAQSRKKLEEMFDGVMSKFI